MNLTIHVGYFDDPHDIPGLAHLVEHVIMRGHASQPGLSTLFREHQIKVDAHTHYNRIIFTISNVHRDLDSVISTLLHYLCELNATSEAVEAELITIHNEFIATKNDGIRALHEVNKSTCNPLHPYAKFPTGNQSTFAQHDIDSLTTQVNQWLHHAIIPKHVDIHVMHPASLPVNDVAVLIETCQLPTRGHNPAPPMRLNDELPSLYLPEQQGIELVVQVNTHQPRLIISLLINTQAISGRALAIVELLLNYPPLTSLPQQLIQHGLIKHYHVDRGNVLPNTCELNINIALTELGLNQYQRIVRLWYYLLQQQSYITPSDIIAHQLSLALDWRAAFDDSTPDWSQWFAHLPKIHQDSENDSTEDNDTLVLQIQQIFTQCRLSNSRILLLGTQSSLPQINAPIQTSYWYGTQYQTQPVPWSESSSDIMVQVDPLVNQYSIDLFILNPFLQQLPPLMPPAKSGQTKQSATIIPCASGSDYFEMVYIESKARSPIVDVFISFEAPKAADESVIAKRIWVEGINEKLMHQRYPLLMIGGNLRCHPHQTGLTLKLSAPAPLISHILSKVMYTILEPLMLISHFHELHQQQLLKIQHSMPQNAYQQAFSQLSEYVGQHTNFSAYQTFEKIKSLDPNSVHQYHAEFFAQCYAEIMLFGEMEQSTRTEIASTLKQVAKSPKPTLQDLTDIDKRKLLITRGAFANSCFVTLYLTPNKTLSDAIFAMALAEVLAEPFFDRFREQLQVGYDVGCGFITHQQHPGISFYVNYTEHEALDIMNYQTEFFTQISDSLVQLRESWPHIQHTLTKQLNPQQLSTSQQAQYYWMQMGRLGGIEHDAQLVKLINNSSFDEFLLFSQTLLNEQQNNVIYSICQHQEDASMDALKQAVMQQMNRC